MMIIKNLRNYKFRDEVGIYSTTGFALYEDGKGFISLDGKILIPRQAERKPCKAY